MLTLYVIMPPIAMGVAYRIFWRNGIFIENSEHNWIVGINIILALMSMYSHYMSLGDQG
jgi:hypothetical protein